MNQIGEIQENAPIHSILYSQDGNYLMSASADRHVRLYNANTMSLIQVYQGHGNAVLDIKVGLDNARFASCSGDRFLFLNKKVCVFMGCFNC